TTTSYIVSVGVTGCARRRSDTVVVEAKPLPSLVVSKDTLICSSDTLQLFATGTGNILWTPNYNISNQTSASPLVSPDLPTKYYVSLTDIFGCTKRDSVFVDVISVLSLDAGMDTTICQTDAIRLNTTSNGLQYRWTPILGLDNPNIKNPIANPDTTMLYSVVATVGSCQAIDSVKVTVVPYPIANAGLDSIICFGASTQLQASGGDVYTWSPTTFLDNPNIANPVATPLRTTLYTVSVRSTTSGCPKPDLDSILVTVRPRVIADAGPRDTVVVTNQPLQLSGTGGLSYLWSPPTGLNNPSIRNPVALLNNDSMRYILTVRDAGNCADTDTIDVIVYKVTADLYVPTAFTPNGDGKNDVFRPIPIGMKSISYFRVYNRWGVLMFSTTEQRKGWDGRYNGKGQDTDTFVWVVEGLDYEGNRRSKKGYVILIR
ncbi:MAG: T9SS type B sorting domain-containing protein, partial [Chitinophagaceae bacterium]